MFIVATIEKYMLMENHIKKIILAGADVFRLNFAYQTIEENLRNIAILQQAIDELNSSTKILIDFPSNKVRLGDFELKLFPVKENETVTLKSSSFTFDCYEYIPVQLPDLGEKLSVGQSVTIGDGEVSMQITEIIDKDTVRATIQNKGVIQYMKTFNIQSDIDDQRIIKNFTEIIEKIKHLELNYFAFPYYNDELFEQLVEIVKKANIDTKIILKIESIINAEKMEKIFEKNKFDLLLIDRGEIGVNSPYYKIGIFQKQITAAAIKHKKPTIVSTQIIESAMNHYIPNRAEILDITNMEIDGVSGILLCRETAINHRAAYAISVAKKIIAEVEKFKQNKKT